MVWYLWLIRKCEVLKTAYAVVPKNKISKKHFFRHAREKVLKSLQIPFIDDRKCGTYRISEEVHFNDEDKWLSLDVKHQEKETSSSEGVFVNETASKEEINRQLAKKEGCFYPFLEIKEKLCQKKKGMSVR